MLLSGKVCTNVGCSHTHVYSGIQYLDCPYCDCHMHSDETIDTIAVYNPKRFMSWIRNHDKPKRIKQDEVIDNEIQQMIQSIQLV